MNLVAARQDILANMKRLDGYLTSETAPVQSFAFDLIKKGVCFVALPDENRIKFYPSRFIGYQDNTMNSHFRWASPPLPGERSAYGGNTGRWHLCGRGRYIVTKSEYDKTFRSCTAGLTPVLIYGVLKKLILTF